MAYINGTRIMSAQVNGLVAIDEELSAVSTNPVQNKAVGNTLANAVKGTVTGIGTVRMDDVSPVEHELDVKVTSKNLFDVAQNCASNNVVEGVVSYEGDIITLTTSKGELYINLHKKVIYPAGTYTLTVFPMSENVAISFWTYDAKGGNETFIAGMSEVMNAPKSVTITRDYDFALCISGNNQNYGTHLFKIQIEQGTTATPYTPYISSVADLDGVLVTRRGKNLFNKDDTSCLLNGYISSAGVYMASSPNREMSFIFKCTPNTDYVVSKLMSLTNRVAGFSTIPSSGTAGTYIGEYIGKTSYTFNSGTAEYIIVWYFNTSGEFHASEEVKASIQLELGTNATPYTPYVEPTIHLANMDGTVSGVLSVSPMTTLTADTDSVVVTATYNKDTNAVINTLVERLAALEAAIVNN